MQISKQKKWYNTKVGKIVRVPIIIFAMLSLCLMAPFVLLWAFITNVDKFTEDLSREDF